MRGWAPAATYTLVTTPSELDELLELDEPVEPPLLVVVTPLLPWPVNELPLDVVERDDEFPLGLAVGRGVGFAVGVTVNEAALVAVPFALARVM